MAWISRLKDGSYYINFDSCHICHDGDNEAEITSQIHLNILRLFAENPNRRFKKDTLIERCWEYTQNSIAEGTWYRTIHDVKSIHKAVKESISSSKVGYCYLGKQIEEIKDNTQLKKTNKFKQDNRNNGITISEDVLERLKIDTKKAEKGRITVALTELVNCLLEGRDISAALDDVVMQSRNLHFEDIRNDALIKLGYCESLTADDTQFDVEIHLQIQVARIHVEIAQIIEKIAKFEEELFASQNQDMHDRLLIRIEAKNDELNEKKGQLQQYEQELERLQRESFSQNTFLNLSIQKNSNNT